MEAQRQPTNIISFEAFKKEAEHKENHSSLVKKLSVPVGIALGVGGTLYGGKKLLSGKAKLKSGSISSLKKDLMSKLKGNKTFQNFAKANNL